MYFPLPLKWCVPGASQRHTSGCCNSQQMSPLQGDSFLRQVRRSPEHLANTSSAEWMEPQTRIPRREGNACRKIQQLICKGPLYILQRQEKNSDVSYYEYYL